MADRTDPSLRIGNLLFQNLSTNLLSYKKKKEYNKIAFNNKRRLAYLYRSFLAVYQLSGEGISCFQCLFNVLFLFL